MKKHIPFLLLSAVATVAQAEKHPNVIIIYVDDMGYGDVGCYGGKFAATPHIDKLAEKGIRFTQYYSAAPVSSASRTGITTGMFPLSWGINTYLSTREHNRNCEQRDFLPSTAPSIARAFQQAGYATGHFGKWHLGGGRDVDNAPPITAYGFDEYRSTWESPDPDPALTSTNWIWAASDSIKRWDRTAYFVDQSLDFIRRNNGKPFFVNLWPDDVHTPWVPDENVQGNNSRYEKEEAFIPVLAELDRQVGRLVEGLEKMNLINNTILIFTSDNGPAPSFEQRRTDGLRGTKNSLYEGGIRMPLIVCWGDKIKQPKTDRHTVLCAIDFYPSLCAMAGIRTEKNRSLHGADMSKALEGKKEISRKDLLFWDFGRNRFFNFPVKEHRSPHLAVRKGDWKLLCNADGSNVELYNIVKDPNEATDLSRQYPELATELKTNIITWYNRYTNH